MKITIRSAVTSVTLAHMAGKLPSGPVSIDQLHLGVRVAVSGVRVPTLDQIPERFAVRIDVMPLDIELAQPARAQFGGAAASQSGQDYHRVVRDFPLAAEPTPDGASLDPQQRGEVGLAHHNRLEGGAEFEAARHVRSSLYRLASAQPGVAPGNKRGAGSLRSVCWLSETCRMTDAELLPEATIQTQGILAAIKIVYS
jgi:hypothetical protein